MLLILCMILLFLLMNRVLSMLFCLCMSLLRILWNGMVGWFFREFDLRFGEISSVFEF